MRSGHGRGVGMILDQGEQELFFRLHKALLVYVNRQLRLVAEPREPGEEFPAFPMKERLRLRDALVDRPDLIDRFVEEDPFGFEPGELEIVESWKGMVAGEFYLLKMLKKHAIFLAATGTPVAYGVVALSDPFEAVVGDNLPRLVRTVLLPFKGRIVYDGLLTGHDVVFGRNITRELNGVYNEARKRGGIVASLPRASGKKAAAKRKAAEKATKAEARKKPGKAASGWVGEWRVGLGTAGRGGKSSRKGAGDSIDFRSGGRGEFQIGGFTGAIDYREGKREGMPAVEFSWLGEGPEEFALGRGWAVLDGGEIDGRLFVHGGGELAFRGERKKR